MGVFLGGLLIGLSGGAFIGMIIMSLCVVSGRNSREEEKNKAENDTQIGE